MAKFQAAGIQPFGVNPAGVEAHASYVKKLRFNFPLLSDHDRGIARAYHALKDDGKGIQRSVYVVRRDGTVAFAQRGACRLSFAARSSWSPAWVAWVRSATRSPADSVGPARSSSSPTSTRRDSRIGPRNSRRRASPFTP